jgi:hypothetical protein
MMALLTFVVGLFVGSFVGVLTVAIAQSSQ